MQVSTCTYLVPISSTVCVVQTVNCFCFVLNTIMCSFIIFSCYLGLKTEIGVLLPSLVLRSVRSLFYILHHC
jgi:hypothetical protein